MDALLLVQDKHIAPAAQAEEHVQVILTYIVVARVYRKGKGMEMSTSVRRFVLENSTGGFLFHSALVRASQISWISRPHRSTRQFDRYARYVCC